MGISRRRAPSVVMILTVLSAVVVPATGALTRASATTVCAPPSTFAGTTFTWTGKGNGRTWTDPANWSPMHVPDVDQQTATYQPAYVCIGKGSAGKAPSVTIGASSAFHVAALDLGGGATLSIAPGGSLYLGAVKGTTPVGSVVEKHSALDLTGATLGGNSPLTVLGTLQADGGYIKQRKVETTLTSSECAGVPAPAACPGDVPRGDGQLTVKAGGTLAVGGSAFGGDELTGGYEIDNYGTVRLRQLGYLAMDAGTALVDRAGSKLELDGAGGIYRGASVKGQPAGTLRQVGRVVRDSAGTNVAVVGVPVTIGAKPPAVTVLAGSVVFDWASGASAPVARNSGYGIGGCALVGFILCHRSIPTASAPQVALVRTSTEGPTVSHLAVSLVATAKTLFGHRTLGRAVTIDAPTEMTTHSTHLTFGYDATTSGLRSKSQPLVYRNGHKITVCAVHGLTHDNTSCLLSSTIGDRGEGSSGDLTLIIITIQPKGTWTVAN